MGVKLKTVTELRRSNARNTFIAESVLNSLWDYIGYMVDILKQRSDVVSFTIFFGTNRIV